MIPIQRFFWAHMLVAVAALSIGYAMAGYAFASLIFVLVGAMWSAARQRSAPGIEGLALTIFLMAGGFGLLAGIPAWLMLVMVVATMGAWDLDHFLQRLNAAGNVDYGSGLGREHIRRLALVEGLGFLTGLLALTTRARIPFWWEALLVLLAVIGIRRLILFVRRQIEE